MPAGNWGIGAGHGRLASFADNDTSGRVDPHQKNGVVLPHGCDRLAAGDRPGQADQLRGVLAKELLMASSALSASMVVCLADPLNDALAVSGRLSMVYCNRASVRR